MLANRGYVISVTTVIVDAWRGGSPLTAVAWEGGIASNAAHSPYGRAELRVQTRGVYF